MSTAFACYSYECGTLKAVNTANEQPRSGCMCGEVPCLRFSRLGTTYALVASLHGRQNGDMSHNGKRINIEETVLSSTQPSVDSRLTNPDSHLADVLQSGTCHYHTGCKNRKAVLNPSTVSSCISADVTGSDMFLCGLCHARRLRKRPLRRCG